VIVMEMINGHALVISLMATALISSRVSRFFAPPLYETLSQRYMAPPPAAMPPAPTTEAADAAPADVPEALRRNEPDSATANETTER
jgi:hypothetical protein